ncbi:hypothetical protein AK812_SmicGene37048 [Symbiodinium microadriaticum]|uniref:Uncharacterized protein n=1 Tax=Symbiodinium microadriaticum TaxID=2951 RepID=A0A1Q9CHA6_SYMMI|nr:hypothetical protein AK812_SmicGene37048 [Symbiodinium microadriaticum]
MASWRHLTPWRVGGGTCGVKRPPVYAVGELDATGSRAGAGAGDPFCAPFALLLEGCWDWPTRHKWLELTANLLEVSGNEPIRSREVEPMEKLDLHMRPVWTLSFQVDGGKDGVHNRLREYFRLSDHNVLMFAGHRFFVGVEGVAKAPWPSKIDGGELHQPVP